VTAPLPVPRMLRNAPHLRRGALLVRGPTPQLRLGPGSAQRHFAPQCARDTGALA